MCIRDRFTGDQEVIRYGVRYASVAFLFSPIIMAGLAFEKIFQAVGRMKVSMIALISGCITNIILDPILIFVMQPLIRAIKMCIRDRYDLEQTMTAKNHSPPARSLRRTQCTNLWVVYNCALSKLRGFRLLTFQQFLQ